MRNKFIYLIIFTFTFIPFNLLNSQQEYSILDSEDEENVIIFENYPNSELLDSLKNSPNLSSENPRFVSKKNIKFKPFIMDVPPNKYEQSILNNNPDYIININPECRDIRDNFSPIFNKINKNLKSKNLLNEEILNLAIQYEKFCLNKVNEIENTNLINKINKITGVLIDKRDNNNPFCMALRLKNNLFVTARHCFYNSKNNKAIKEVTKRKLTKYEYIDLALLENPLNTFKVLEVIDSSDSIKQKTKFYHEDDYIFLKTENINIDLPEYVISNPQQKNNIIMLGIFSFATSTIESLINNLPYWVSQIRWEKEGICVVNKFDKNCIYHGCTSIGSYSGSPMFNYHYNGTLEIIGMHISSFIEEDHCRDTDIMNFGDGVEGNVALILNNEIKSKRNN